jgi:hypothetical protein
MMERIEGADDFDVLDWRLRAHRRMQVCGRHIYIYTHTHTHIHTHIYTHWRLRAHRRMQVCVYICEYMCVYIRICVCRVRRAAQGQNLLYI